MFADQAYYTDVYHGNIISKDKLEKYLEEASDDINSLCFGKIIGIGFECLYPRQQELIKKAVCRQAEYNFQYGSYLDSPLKSYSAGSTSVSMENTKENEVQTTSKVIRLLEDTGLRCRVL